MKLMKKLKTAIGLMSGTSGDGIDASIIKSDGEDHLEILGNYFYPYEKSTQKNFRDLKNKIEKIRDLKENQLLVSELEREITILHAKTIKLIIKKVEIKESEIDVVGFHGQTIFHSYQDKISRQLGDGRLLAQLTKQDIIYNFRENDILNGGQGAPLTPVFHKLIQKKYNLKLPLAVINIGGITNITYFDKKNEIKSYDSGPGNFLIDKFLQVKTKSKLEFDEDGKIAHKGFVNQIVLDSYLNDPYYNLTPPKSLDVNDFSLGLVRGLNLENSVTTLSELTVISIINSLNFFPDKPELIILSGGGRKNKYFSRRIEKLSRIKTEKIDNYKIDGDFVESQAFAYLAIRSLYKKVISYPDTTGVVKPLSGGVLIKIK